MALAVSVLVACEFSDVVEIGRDEARGDGSGGHGSAGFGAGAAAGAAALPSVVGQGAGGGAPVEIDRCGIWSRPDYVWAMPTNAAGDMVPGSGGPLLSGEYRLTQLVSHGLSPCVDEDRPLAQTLVFGADTGFVISAYQRGDHFSTAFTFATHDNHIDIQPTCHAPESAPATVPFGPFETYTATTISLQLFSEACRYRAEYARVVVPTR